VQTATRLIYERRFDLLVIDLMIPNRPDSDEPVDITDEILPTLESSEKHRGAAVIAISQFDDIVESHRKQFVEAGIILCHFDQTAGQWEHLLSAAIDRFSDLFTFDCIIICALEKERGGYGNTEAVLGSLRNIRGLDRQEIAIGDHSGICIKLPRMGLVDASIITSRAIDRFNPRIVAISGICAGIRGKADIGTLVVADICWEYQAGKWSDNAFKIEHYDIGIDADVKTTLNQLILADPKGKGIKDELIEDEVLFKSIVIEPMATGSAVIASRSRMGEIEKQHRKMAALDMETYGVYRAAALSASTPLFFGAKMVVDNGDGDKGDRYHEYGCVVSARFVVQGLKALLNKT
jgi:adenosylhomocysteine nucleosidase